MSRSFRGESLNKIDGKGRVSIPASFRRVIEAGDPNWQVGQNAEFAIVYGDDDRNYLECYTIEGVDAVDARIQTLEEGSDEREYLEWIFNGLSLYATVDDTGRIVIPAKQREKIGLEGEAYFIAAGDKFQIWNPETYETEALAKKRAMAAKFPAGFNPRKLLAEAPKPASET